MYAIVKVGGKQYRVEKGDSLVVDRMSESEGAKVALEPLLYRSDKTVFDGAELGKVKVEAVVTGHERGKKLHVLKFKPKHGYTRRTGHRSELTRLEIKDIKLQARKAAEPAPKAEAKAPARPKAEAKAPTRPKAGGKAKAESKPKGKGATSKGKASTPKGRAKSPAAKRSSARAPRKKGTKDGS
jgi:large subunit ribosomal protein L21